ncbi:MAG: tetratricopeptide repeat protein [Polyangiaceae bacterium]
MTARWSLALIGALLVHTSVLSAAPSKADRKKAQDIAGEATREFKAGNFTRAAELVREAYDLDPAPTLLYNLARALEAADDEEGALAAYERYLREDPKSENRGAVEQRIDTLKANLEEKRSAASRPAPSPAPAPSKAATTTPRSDARADEGGGAGPFPFVLMGAGVAGLATGTVLGVMANSAKQRAEDPATSGVDTLDERDRAKTLGVYSTVGFAAGGVLLAGGLTWWALTPRKQESASVRLQLAPGEVSVAGSF